ncbi:MAG: hypothetical protein ACE5JR_09055 [Gemmatimonadota bacterium]
MSLNPGNRTCGSVLRVFGLLCLLGVVTPREAYGYIDPLSGSLVIQVVTAAVVAAGITLKRPWLRVTALVSHVWGRLVRR